MDALVRKLEEKLRANPGNRTLLNALSHLSAIEHDSARSGPTYDLVTNDFDALQKEGLWGSVPEEIAILQGINAPLTPQESGTTTPSSSLRTGAVLEGESQTRLPGVVAHPTPSAPRLPLPSDSPTALPLELVDSLNQGYFLHVLATDPAQVLPPGKSLLSVLSRPHSHINHTSALHDRVEDLVHRAFWDEALESLSNLIPSIQLSRIKRLYDDLYIGLSALLPPGHPVLVTLSSPLSPTSSPLRSASTHLREVLLSLRERCAPTRDSYIDSLMQKLEDQANSDLASVVVDVIRLTLKLAEEMKDDLSQFVLGTMGEKQLHAVISSQAAELEKEQVLHLWAPEQVHSLWTRWLSDLQLSVESAHLSVHEKFIRRLTQALSTNRAVRSPLSATPHEPTSQLNSLPPPLFFEMPTLFLIQNYLQALVIAASLRSLVRLPPSSSLSISTTKDESAVSERSFMERIWSLLKAEIEEEPDADGAKLLNLADEVVRARRLHGSHGDASADAEDESRLRAAVDRTVQWNDPVFVLLRKRLVEAVCDRLLEPPADTPRNSSGPTRLQTGRDRERGGQMPHMRLAVGNEPVLFVHDEKLQERPLSIKGFEDPVLTTAVLDLIGKLRKSVQWTETVWVDLFEGRDLVPSH